jgi:hypothetical protein
LAFLDNGTYSESSLSDWVMKAPRQLLANNLGLPKKTFAAVKRTSVIVASDPLGPSG